jgi:RNA polymerase sigma factor (sigma-70 family)
MNEPTGLTVLIDRFEESVWDLDAVDLQKRECDFQEACAPAGTRLDAILAEQSDETLALAVQKRFLCKEVFTELFQRYEHRLIAWFSRWRFSRWGTADEAFDLTQEMFLKLYRKGLATYDPSRPFCCYLRSAAYHLWIARERGRPRPVLQNDFEDVPAPGGVHQNPVLDELEMLEAKARLERALKQLPEGLSAVLELCLDGLSADEIVNRFHITKQQVYRRLHRARELLAELLGIELPPSNRGRKPKKDQTELEGNTSHS